MTTIDATVNALRKLAGAAIARDMQRNDSLQPHQQRYWAWAKKECLERLHRGDRACLPQNGVFSGAVAIELQIPHAYARRRLKKAEAEGVVISSATSGGCTRWWPVGMAEQLLALYEPKPAACRICGCTDTQACQGGCWWVEPDLCSARAEAPMPFGDSP